MKALFLFVCGILSLSADREELFIPRKDGTSIQGYFDRPNCENEVPIVIFIDGSHEASVATNHEKLAERFNPHKIGFLSIEKRGITSKRVNRKEFVAHDCFEERVSDYSLLLTYLAEGKITGWNGHCVLLGASEGGKIAPRLHLAFPSIVQGVVLIASGGGFSFAEEMKFQSEQLIKQMSLAKRGAYKSRGAMFPNEIDKFYAKMLQKPESLKMCGPKTWKWFASYLRYNLLSDLLKIEAPLYMIHGEKDIMVPIKSADLINKAFETANKSNLHYARYDDLGHSMAGREDAYSSMIEWIVQCFQKKI